MSNKKNLEWAVIGAGPAGIATIGTLIDKGIKSQDIAWIDPEFKVGDFGTRWRNVSSNTKVDLFLKFLNACRSFDYANCQKKFPITQLNPKQTCLLKYAADPLQWITNHLKQQVTPIEDRAQKLKLENGYWQISLSKSTLYAKNVVMAQGSIPKTLPQYTEIPIIPLEKALDEEHISQEVNSKDVVAVFGASHSGIISIRLLLAAGVKQVINFYSSALRYAIDLDGWILFDNTGLKGETAAWAREHMSKISAEKLLRIESNEENTKKYLPMCSKAIHAVGFSRRHIPVEGLAKLEYNVRSGIIAPGLFGIGIAFPEETTDPFGNVELSVGLWKFMQYLQRVLPIWLKYGS